MAITSSIRDNVQMSSEFLYENCSGGLFITSILFVVINISVVGLRFLSRRLSHTPPGRDDFMTLPALFFCLTVCAMGIVMIKVAGVGRNAAALTVLHPETLIIYRKTLIIVEFLNVAAFTSAKLAILALYLRVFTLKPYRISVYVIGSIVIANWAVALVLSIFKCAPFAYNWDRTIPYGSCLDINREYQWITFPSIITDVMMLLLPMRVVWKLQLPKIQKLGLAMTFLTGSIGMAISIVRFAVFNALPDVGPVFNYQDVDDTWDAAALMIWTIVEPSTYLAASCFPTYRTLFQLALPRIRSLGSMGRTKVLGGSSSAAGVGVKRSNQASESKTRLRPEISPPLGFNKDQGSSAVCTREKTSRSDNSIEDLEAGYLGTGMQENQSGILVRTNVMLTRSD